MVHHRSRSRRRKRGDGSRGPRTSSGGLFRQSGCRAVLQPCLIERVPPPVLQPLQEQPPSLTLSSQSRLPLFFGSAVAVGAASLVACYVSNDKQHDSHAAQAFMEKTFAWIGEILAAFSLSLLSRSLTLWLTRVGPLLALAQRRTWCKRARRIFSRGTCIRTMHRAISNHASP